MLPHDGKQLLVFLGLRILGDGHRQTVARADALDIEFRDIQIESGRCVIVETLLHLRRRHVIKIEIMSLDTDAVDQVLGLEQLDDCDQRGSGRWVVFRAIFVDQELCIGKILPSFLKRPDYPIPTGSSIAPQRILKGARGFHRFVYHVDRPSVGVFLATGFDPVLHRSFLVGL